MTRDLWQERLSEYIDGELSAQESAALEAHITSCNDCTDILEALRGVKEEARVLDDRPAPPELWDAIASAISAASVSEPVSAPAGRVAPVRSSAPAHRPVARMLSRFLMRCPSMGGFVHIQNNWMFAP